MGYLVVLFGVVAYVVGCFLPIYWIPQLVGRTFTLYEQIVGGSGDPLGAMLGGGLVLFGGVATVGATSLVGLRGRSERWNLGALVGAVVVWSLTSIGLLVDVGRLYGSLRWGYWTLLSSVGCVVAGTIIVMVSARSEAGTTNTSSV